MSAKQQSDLFLAKQVKALDELAIKSGLPGSSLMNQAGQALFSLLQTQYPKTQKLHIFSGGGNNGGDGFVMAKLAHKANIKTQVYLLNSPEKLQGEALQAYEALVASGITPPIWKKSMKLDNGVVIDAMLGTGVTGSLKANYLEAIEAINQSGLPVIAVDIPTGLNPDTGTVAESVVKANHTLCFIGLKAGLLTHDGPDNTGTLHLEELPIPAAVRAQVSPFAELLQFKSYESYLPKRKRNSHKNKFGHVLIVGGNGHMSGAAVMTGLAAFRSGAGLVSIATLNSHAEIMDSQYPELMCHGISTPKELVKLIEQASVIAIGPGLGQDAWAQSLFNVTLNTDKPLIIDADALTLLASTKITKEKNWILTPHPGEAARLLNKNTQEIQQNRFESARECQKQYGGCVVLKGNGTIICDNTASLSLCSQGNPGMSSAGMGDILTGILAGLAAQQLPLAITAKVGTLVHALAADSAAQSGERGLMATDLLMYIKQWVNPL